MGGLTPWSDPVSRKHLHPNLIDHDQLICVFSSICDLVSQSVSHLSTMTTVTTMTTMTAIPTITTMTKMTTITTMTTETETLRAI